MNCTTIHLISFLCGLVFGLIGIGGAAFLSYYANLRVRDMMKEHNASRVVIDEMHRLTNSAFDALKESNELLKNELAQVKSELAQVIKQNLKN